jgi:ankyrin repeat protein
MSESNSGRPPLHAAASSEKFETLQLLLEAGALVNAQNSALETPLHLALFWPYEKTATILLKAGAKTDVVNIRGQTPDLGG